MKNQFDVVVIGAGPAGYVAAIRCAQLGFNTACVDSWQNDSGQPAPGGTCLNVGCIPSKTLLESSEIYEQVADASLAQHGVSVSGLQLDLASMMKRKQTVVNDLTLGIANLFKSNGVHWHSGIGCLHGPEQVSVRKKNCNEVTILHAKHVILAAGSSPMEINAAPVDKQWIVDSSGALSMQQVPEVLGIIGAGVIGLELGSVWRRLGSRVILFEAQPSFLPSVDSQIAREALKLYQQQGLEFRFNTRVSQTEVLDDGVLVHCEEQGEIKTQRVNRLVVAVGRQPNSEGLVSEQLNLAIDSRGYVKVDEYCKTNIDNVYAIGDLVRGPMLAHKGSEEGIMVAERIAGNYAEVNYNNIPSVVYTQPEIAWVGETEQSLQAAQHEYRTGVFPFTASGRARSAGDSQGLVKVIADAHTDQILGVHMIGRHCSELIMQAVIANEFSASAEDLALTMFAHPTFSEALHEAALAVSNRAIHIAKTARKRA